MLLLQHVSIEMRIIFFSVLCIIQFCSVDLYYSHRKKWWNFWTMISYSRVIFWFCFIFKDKLTYMQIPLYQEFFSLKHLYHLFRKQYLLLSILVVLDWYKNIAIGKSWNSYLIKCYSFTGCLGIIIYDAGLMLVL